MTIDDDDKVSSSNVFHNNNIHLEAKNPEGDGRNPEGESGPLNGDHEYHLHPHHHPNPNILSCSSFSSKSTVPSPFPYTRIHAHCENCVRPLRCIRKPAFATSGGVSGALALSPDELFAMILSVNFYNNAPGLLPPETDALESCPVVRCPNDASCLALLHYCKLPEHFLLCMFQKIPCLNATYGCPFTMTRREVPAHLKRGCPANVVHCSAEWNRLPLHATELKSPQTRAVYCPPQALDVRNLDVALALRDQRMLKQLWSASRQMKRIMRGCLSTHPAVPIKPYIGVRTYREYGPAGGGNVTSSPSNPEEIGGLEQNDSPAPNAAIIHHDEELYFAFADRLVDAALADSLVEMLKRSAVGVRRAYDAQRRLVSADAARAVSVFQGRQKSNSICCQSGVCGVSGVSPPLQPPLCPSMESRVASSTSINLPIISDSIVQQSAEIEAENGKNQEQSGQPQEEGVSSHFVQQSQPPAPPPVPKCNALSLEVSIRSLAAYQPKPRSMYTFRCGGDYRVDEVAAHHRDIHSDIHGGLDGWLEHRCPLFQLGCPFVHRRWAPVTGDGRVQRLVYNEGLEAFACGDPVQEEEVEEEFSLKNSSLTSRSPLKKGRRGGCNASTFGPTSRRGSSVSGTSLTSCFCTNSNCTVTCCSCANGSPSASSRTFCSTMSLLSSPSTSTAGNSSSSSSSNMSLPSSPSFNKFIAGGSFERPDLPRLYEEEVEVVEVGDDDLEEVYGLNDFPVEIVQHICNYLDGYSLNSLSFTCSRLRLVVQSFLKKKGYVLLQWKRYEVAKGQYRWKVAYKKWMFSTSIAPIGGWALDSDNVVGEHLRVCPFNDRQTHGTRPFQVIFLNADSTVMMKRQRP